MSNELNTVAETVPSLPQNPFAPERMANINEGAVSIEGSRAVAEAQGKLLIAKRFPRDQHTAYEKLMSACERKSLAEKAIYSYPKGGQTIEGPSIRLAEEIARCWGNIEFGIKELSQRDGESEMLAYCWDMETNVMSSQTFVVRHERDSKYGKQALNSQRDIYENNANMAGRRLRARILAVLPPDIVEDAVQACRRTLAGGTNTPIEDRVKALLLAFKKFGVKHETIEQRLGRPLDTMTADDIVEYRGIYNSLKDKNTTIADWFDIKTNSDRAKALTAELTESKEG